MARKIAVEAINKAYSVLSNTTLFNAVEGNFFKGKKPDDFIGECVVITSLPMSRDQLQVCRIMVNIHVPNLEIELNDKIDRSQANYPRIAILSKIVDDTFIEFDEGDISFRIEDDHVMENEGFDEHYNNYRIVFRNVNI